MSFVAVSPFDIRSTVNIFGTILGCRMKRFPLRGIARSLDAKKIKKVPKDDRVPIELAFWPVAQENFFHEWGHSQMTGRMMDLLTFSKSMFQITSLLESSINL